MPIKAIAPDIYHIIPAPDAPFGLHVFHPPDDLWPRVLCPPGHISWVPRHWISDIIITPTTEVGPVVVPLL
jgi:hypothetical protein